MSTEQTTIPKKEEEKMESTRQEQPAVETSSNGAAAAAAASSSATASGTEIAKQPPHQQERQQIYSCQRCRMRLFSTFHLVPHDAAADAAGHKKFRGNKFHESGAGKACTSVFLDDGLLEWVKSGVNEDNGSDSADDKDLLCPNAKCKFKIGSKQWQGTQCSCGAWVTPAFKVLLSRVDRF